MLVLQQARANLIQGPVQTLRIRFMIEPARLRTAPVYTQIIGTYCRVDVTISTTYPPWSERSTSLLDDGVSVPYLSNSAIGAESRFPGKVVEGGCRPSGHVWSSAELQAKNERDRVVCAHVYGLGWSEKSPGQDGMRYALFPFTTAVLEDFVRMRV
jgi:hypothetical protein